MVRPKKVNQHVAASEVLGKGNVVVQTAKSLRTPGPKAYMLALRSLSRSLVSGWSNYQQFGRMATCLCVARFNNSFAIL